ncbi:MAG: hypothetical protein GF344_13755 [Chitinivibrionales bacterium]|nr:hypothetical protein [Chitinivibrionales bacterium]MBD3357794.1 hypothetical protein [Chitinivibrionales bacterium]
MKSNLGTHIAGRPVSRPRACGRWIALAAVVVMSCVNPFFPPEGLPRESGRLRSTPLGAVLQLKTAYEKKSIGLFQDLFARDKSFRFYVASSLASQFSGIVAAEKIDTAYTNVAPGVYHYWGYDLEMRVHRRMFSQVRRIDFVVPPSFYEQLFVADVNIEVDTIGVDSVGDSVSFRIQRTYDTTKVEVPMYGGTMEFVMEDGSKEEVGIGRQVFCVVPDPEDPSLWVIDKWFDLGN